MVQTQQYF